MKQLRTPPPRSRTCTWTLPAVPPTPGRPCGFTPGPFYSRAAHAMAPPDLNAVPNLSCHQEWPEATRGRDFLPDPPISPDREAGTDSAFLHPYKTQRDTPDWQRRTGGCGVGGVWTRGLGTGGLPAGGGMALGPRSLHPFRAAEGHSRARHLPPPSPTVPAGPSFLSGPGTEETRLRVAGQPPHRPKGSSPAAPSRAPRTPPRLTVASDHVPHGAQASGVILAG